MKMSCKKYSFLGGAIGLADGLLFVTAFHTGLDFLAPILVWPAFPCWWVARIADGHGWHEGIAWGLGVVALGAFGALIGLSIATVDSFLSRRTRRTAA